MNFTVNDLDKKNDVSIRQHLITVTVLPIQRIYLTESFASIPISFR